MHVPDWCYSVRWNRLLDGNTMTAIDLGAFNGLGSLEIL